MQNVIDINALLFYFKKKILCNFYSLHQNIIFIVTTLVDYDRLIYCIYRELTEIVNFDLIAPPTPTRYYRFVSQIQKLYWEFLKLSWHE